MAKNYTLSLELIYATMMIYDAKIYKNYAMD